MWTLSRHHLCLTFLLVCVLAGTSFLHLYQGLFQGGLDLSFLCADRHLVAAPVAIFCPSGAGTALNTSSSCAQLPAPPSGAWTISPEGRLGNQMGQYATLLALARLNRRQAFILPAMHAALAPVFRITLPVLAPEVDRRTPWQSLELHDWMSEEYARLQQPLLKLSGFPCSWTFFHHLREQIRREFTLHDHLREGGTTWRPCPSAGRGCNGMAWCRENVDTSRGDVVFAGDGQEASPGKDFALLTQCNHTVMTIGTFGFWAAYLAGGDTVYLANFTLPDSDFLKIFKPEAAFLPEWVGINADLSPLQKPRSPGA
ncbi:Galactoside 2-alpha-L-fucosyltransferase 1 [Myotis brandtii]|uniref:L-Fucosyltransferase n=1 Tax=Myotis brandtii TaxID=109478 RepID=S7NF03_MYOBR|nr:Galactoside 2-alpha-L-fucosyltransferase 1 [Myotis brandtii]